MNPQLHGEIAARERLGGIGRSLYYDLLGSGELRSVKIGKRRLVPEQAICEYIERLERESDQDATTSGRTRMKARRGGNSAE